MEMEMYRPPACWVEDAYGKGLTGNWFGMKAATDKPQPGELANYNYISLASLRTG